MESILTAIALLGGLGVAGALLLWVVSKRFRVEEDPRIGEIERMLPGANCGGCGRSGCHDFACACAVADSLDGLNCPGAGPVVMKQIADLLGLTPAPPAKPMIAVVKCNGTCDVRPGRVVYDGPVMCAVAHAVSSGEGGCPNGCLGCGDCVAACRWDAIHINPATGLPEVDEDRCTGCGGCVPACPRAVIELRLKGAKGRRVYVACNNRERGAVAMKECGNACIGCAKCAKECNFEAITVTSNLAYIDADKCRLCRKCVDVCPTKAIHTVNFPVKQQVVEAK